MIKAEKDLSPPWYRKDEERMTSQWRHGSTETAVVFSAKKQLLF